MGFPDKIAFRRSVRGGCFTLSRLAGRIIQIVWISSRTPFPFAGAEACRPAWLKDWEPAVFHAVWVGRIEFRVWHPQWTQLICRKPLVT